MQIETVGFRNCIPYWPVVQYKYLLAYLSHVQAVHEKTKLCLCIFMFLFAASFFLMLVCLRKVMLEV